MSGAFRRAEGKRNLLEKMIAGGLNSPRASSMGRLFDGVYAHFDRPGARDL